MFLQKKRWWCITWSCDFVSRLFFRISLCFSRRIFRFSASIVCISCFFFFRARVRLIPQSTNKTFHCNPNGIVDLFFLSLIFFIYSPEKKAIYKTGYKLFDQKWVVVCSFSPLSLTHRPQHIMPKPFHKRWECWWRWWHEMWSMRNAARWTA